MKRSDPNGKIKKILQKLIIICVISVSFMQTAMAANIHHYFGSEDDFNIILELYRAREATDDDINWLRVMYSDEQFVSSEEDYNSLTDAEVEAKKYNNILHKQTVLRREARIMLRAYDLSTLEQKYQLVYEDYKRAIEENEFGEELSSVVNQTFSVRGILTAPGQEQKYLGDPNDPEDQPVLAFLLEIINFLSLMAGITAFGIIMIGGLRLLAGLGNDDAVQKGKDMIGSAIIGLVIGMLSYIITSFIQSILYAV